jgi:hypothetical protein
VQKVDWSATVRPRCLVLEDSDEAPIERRKRDLPEIAGGPKEFDTGGALVVFCALNAHDAAVLLFPSLPVEEPEHLAGGDAGVQDDESPMSAYALHMRRFAEKLGIAIEGCDFDWNREAEALASALCATLPCGSWRIHQERE